MRAPFVPALCSALLLLLLPQAVPHAHGQARAPKTPVNQDTTTADTITAPRDSVLWSNERFYARFVEGRIYEGLVRAYEYGAEFADPERLRQLYRVFDPKESHWAAYPLFSTASGWRATGGGKVLYDQRDFAAAGKLRFTDMDKWEYKLQFTRIDTTGGMLRQASLTLLRSQDDDMRFYGIGAHPWRDGRSHFQERTDEEYGIFNQDLMRAQFILGLRTSPEMEFRFTSQYQQRRILGPWFGDDAITTAFDVFSLPGGHGTTRSVYQEAATVYQSGGQTRPGVQLEGYAGLLGSLGGERDIPLQLRYGADLHWWRALRFIAPSHMLHLRFVANLMERVSGQEAVAFYDYPRHPSFRGVSTRYLLRNDKLVFVPSAELSHRLLKWLTGRVFTDYLFVGRRLELLQPGTGIWAVGGELAFHNLISDLAGFSFAYSPKGVRVSVYIGEPSNRNERSRWR